MRVSFLVINYNGGAYIDACLASIRLHASSIDHEVIVVDNHSVDGSVKALKEKFPEVKLLLNSRNVGFSRAMNQAYRASTGTYIFSFNPDAELTAGCMETLISYMDTHPRVGKIGTATIEDGRILLPATDFPKWNSLQTLKAIKSKLPSPTFSTIIHNSSVEWLFGTGILVRRAAISSQESMYEEKSFLFWEEYWLSKQIRQNGFEIIVLPEARIVHHAGVTFKKNQEKLKVARMLSVTHEFLIRRSHYGWWNARLNALILFADHLLLFLILMPKRFIGRSNLDLHNTLNDYYSKARAAGLVLLKPMSELDSFDHQAEEFFNR